MNFLTDQMQHLNQLYIDIIEKIRLFMKYSDKLMKLHEMSDWIRWCIAVFGIAVVFAALWIVMTGHRNPNGKFIRKIRHSVWISAKTFLAQWIVEEHRTARGDCVGYKYCDTSGCYVIRTWKGFGPVRWEKNCYVGQSSHILNRVHNHMTGKGNGDIYHDIREGRHVKVRFVKAPERSLNELEIRLIARYHAESSYNKTAGGGAKRKKWPFG